MTRVVSMPIFGVTQLEGPDSGVPTSTRTPDGVIHGGRRHLRCPRGGPNTMAVEHHLYFISMAARLLDMHPQTLRKYERLGLVRPTRTVGSMRVLLARGNGPPEVDQTAGRGRWRQPGGRAAAARHRRGAAAAAAAGAGRHASARTPGSASRRRSNGSAGLSGSDARY